MEGVQQIVNERWGNEGVVEEEVIFIIIKGN